MMKSIFFVAILSASLRAVTFLYPLPGIKLMSPGGILNIQATQLDARAQYSVFLGSPGKFSAGALMGKVAFPVQPNGRASVDYPMRDLSLDDKQLVVKLYKKGSMSAIAESQPFRVLFRKILL